MFKAIAITAVLVVVLGACGLVGIHVLAATRHTDQSKVERLTCEDAKIIAKTGSAVDGLHNRTLHTQYGFVAKPGYVPLSVRPAFTIYDSAHPTLASAKTVDQWVRNC